MKRLLLLFLLLIAQSHFAFSEIITVTSKADAGTGTLREALTRAAANGTADKDFIHFNLPGSSAGDRTITITSLLPEVSSNIEIDGTTQPGLNFGVSDAKVNLISAISGNYPALFTVNKQINVSFFGLSFDKQSGIGVDNFAIRCLSSKDVVIGSSGKGNVFGGIHLLIDQSIEARRDDIALLSENITISANIIGLKDDGETVNYLRLQIGPVRNLTIGGNTAADGNVICAGFDYTDYVFTDLNTGKFFFANNKVGVNFTGSRVVTAAPNNTYLSVWGTMLDALEFKNNQLCGEGNVSITDINVPFKFIGNKFGTDATGTQSLGTTLQSILIGYCEGTGVIGGPLASDKNIFSGAFTAGFSAGFTGVVMNVGSPKIEVVNNIFRCNNNPRSYYLTPSNTGMPVTTINITSRNASEIKGKATPGSRVDLYYSLTCSFCEPEQLFASVNADQNGNWIYAQPLQNSNIIAAATLNGSTSEFTSLRFDYQPFDLTIDMACDNSKGNIKGIKFLNATNYGWYTENGDLVSKTIDLINAEPGRYQFRISDDYCSISSEIYEIKHIVLQTELTNMQIKSASCNANDGKITGIQSNGIFYNWYDSRNSLRSSGLELLGVEAGAYTLKVTYNNCSKTFGPFIIPNVNGLSLDESSKQISNATCNENNGSIKNIIVQSSGAITYTWRNGNGQIVGTALNLIDVPEGSYVLEVKDNNGCAPQFSSPINISRLSQIVINKSAILITKAICNTSNGSVTGISAAGATDYKWTDANNAVMSNTIQLTGVQAGKYRLVASNAVCTASEEFTIELAQSTKNYSSTKVITNAQCGQNNGKIEVIFTNDQPVAYRWQNRSGQTVGNSRILENTLPGTYDQYITDDLGCERFSQQYIIQNTVSAAVNLASATIIKDQCGLGTGRISAPALTGGQLPYFYEWKDKEGRVVGSGATLDLVKAGTYQLTLGDAMPCSRQTISYTVPDQAISLPTPSLNDVKICASGKAVVQVMQPEEGTYVIYDENGSLIEKSSQGIFNVNVTRSQNYTVVLQQGNCQSLPAAVKVTIENNGMSMLANTFSPNADGHNDEWRIPGIVNYPTATVDIFNRYGTKVFGSVGYKTSFNGRRNGIDLPAGVYYYIIDLKRGCGLLKGSLTILR